MISVVTTLGGTIVQRKTDRRAKERQHLATIEKEKAKIEAELRKNYQSLSICLLKASFKLAERLSALAEHSSGEEPNETDLDTRNGYSPTYSAYLLARYLAAVELLKKRSATLDLGFPAADRIFLNILGRIQGVLSADDRLVLRMQDKERLFKPTPGDRPVPGGPLRVLPRAQLCLGELLLKEHWKMETQNVNADDGPSMNSILSYVEFREMLETDKSLRRWFNPVLQNFRALHNDKKKLDPRRAHEVNRAIGARVYMLQCALMDLVDFLDPGPKPRYVPMFKRRRLRLGGSSYMEEPEMPASLIALYNQLATLRDTRAGTAKMPHQDVVEVFIKSPEGCSNLFMQPGENGDCPFSQRVLLVLEEMGIPYNSISIDADAKPAWFHLVHPRNQTPVVYHEGQLLIESNQIVTYLINRFPEKTQLADAAHLRLKFGPAKFRRFHPAFVEWLCGRRVSKPVFEKEIRELNDILGQIRICNDGQPFFGGDKFSREDTALVPFLHHVSVAGKSIMGYEVPEDCHFVTDYLTAAREKPSFQKTVAQTRSIVQGYQRLKKTGQMREVALSDSLE